MERFWTEAGFTPEQRAWAVFQSRRFDAVLRAARESGMRADWRVLDVGAGAGGLSVALHAVLGGTFELADFLEPAPRTKRALADQGIERFVHVDLTSREPFHGIPPDRDLLLFVEVLEHLLVNPASLLRRMGDLLRPGGLLLLTTPNQARWGNRVRLALGRPIREPDAFPEGDLPTYGHVQEYVPDEVVVLLQRAGFRLLSQRVVQNLPCLRPSRRQRLGTRLLSSGAAGRLRLGDEMVLVAQRPP